MLTYIFRQEKYLFCVILLTGIPFFLAFILESAWYEFYNRNGVITGKNSAQNVGLL